ncbi:MAG: Ig-like domain-containing protein [Nanoarchaeota archaeon]|nr:Ig-like domain-containing protein [Nanoarchaeota archaeon]
MKINKKLWLIGLIILINLYTLVIFSFIFLEPSGTTFEKLTGKPTGNIELCLDQWIELVQLSDQKAYVGIVYNVDINVTNDASYSVLNYTDDSDLFAINESTGKISFMPVLGDVAAYVINITVSNLQCNEYDDYMLFNLTINRSNYAPILNLSSNFTNLVEDVLFIFDVSNNASDPDGDPLLFYDNTSLFNIGLNTGIIAFIPNNNDVGNHSVKITVSDRQYIDDQDIIFQIRNVNDAPVLETIGAQTAYVNHTFKLNISAYDVDANENLTFASNTSWFFNMSGPNATVNNYVQMNLTLNFTDFDLWNGTYSINITVNDTNGTLDSEVISFTVTYFNHAPNITSYYPITKQFSLQKGLSKEFNITKEDVDGTIPSTKWLIDDVDMNLTSDNFTWSTQAYALGEHNLTVRITDGALDDAESWIVTLTAPPVPTIPAPKLSGIASSPGVITIRCIELWICSDWSICSPMGIQTRECEDLHKCGTLRNKPEESQSCKYVAIPSCFDGVQNQNEVLVDCGGICKPCPTCDDLVQNQGEKGIDCGGPCFACKEVREPAKISKLVFSKEGFVKLNKYWLFWFIISLVILSLIRFGRHIHLQGAFALITNIKIPFRIYKIKSLLARSKSLMKRGNVVKAKKLYNKAKEIYLGLPGDIKKKIKF